jgi:hypothetical protein
MFIEINGTILDKKEYSRKVILLKRLLKYEFSEIIRKYGFKKCKEDKGRCSATFVSEDTFLRVKIVFEEHEQKPL